MMLNENVPPIVLKERLGMPMHVSYCGRGRTNVMLWDKSPKPSIMGVFFHGRRKPTLSLEE